MPAQRNFWSVGGKLCCHCIVLVPFVFARPLEAKPVYTVLSEQTSAYSINDSGAITGQYVAEAGFLRTPDGTITTFHAPGDAAGTVGLSINADDAIAGDYLDAKFLSHGFVRSADGTITTFDVTGAAKGTFPACITGSGMIVGSYQVRSAAIHGFMRAPDGTITPIDIKHASNSDAAGANDDGTIAGEYWNFDGVRHGYVRDPNGKITTFDAPGATNGTFVQSINSKGQIAGAFVDASKMQHGYIRSAGGTFTIFDAPGPGTVALGINANGETTGTYNPDNGVERLGFLRKPNGTIASFQVPHANGGTVPVSVNASGVIAGTSFRLVHHILVPSAFIRTP